MMTPDLALAAALRVAHGAAAQAAVLCRALLPAPDSDVVAVVQPGSRLEQHLVATIPEDRLFRLGTRPDDGLAPPLRRSSEAGGWIITAGAADVDTPPGVALPWPHKPGPGWRARRLDTLFTDHRRIGLIVTDDAAEAPGLLRGAGAILAAAAPPIVLDLSALRPADRLAAWTCCAAVLEGAGYAWHDGMLMPCEVGASVIESLGDAAVCAVPGLAMPPLAKLVAGGWVPPVGTACPVEAASLTRFDADLPCVGFHPPEPFGETSLRWSGAGPVSAFALRLPGPGRWRLVLEIADWGAGRDPGGVLVHADGERLALLDAAAGRLRFGEIAVAPGADHGRLIVELATPRPAPRHGDARVGIAVRQATLERAG